MQNRIFSYNNDRSTINLTFDQEDEGVVLFCRILFDTLTGEQDTHVSEPINAREFSNAMIMLQEKGACSISDSFQKLNICKRGENGYLVNFTGRGYGNAFTLTDVPIKVSEIVSRIRIS